MVSEKCNARDRSKCKFHGELDHARMDQQSALKKYQDAIEAYNNATPEEREIKTTRWGQSKPAVLNKVNNTKTTWMRAQAKLDAIPSEFKKLKAQLDSAKTPDAEKAELQKRLTRADKRRKSDAAERKKNRELQKREEEAVKKNAVLFAQISGEVKQEAQENGWKAGYKKAVSGVIARDGYIVNGPGYSSYGSYFPDNNRELTDHFRSCGALDIRDIEEDAWEE